MRRFLAWALVSGVVLAGVAVIAVFPTRTYLAQRGETAAVKARLEVLTKENAELAARAERLNSDAEIERLAREQYSLVKPGEEAYAILPSPTTTVPPAAAAARREAREEQSKSDSLLDKLIFWD